MVKIRCKEPRNIKRFHLRSGLLHLLSNEGAGVDYKSDHLHKASRDDGKAATKGLELELQGKGSRDDKGRPETLESPVGRVCHGPSADPISRGVMLPRLCHGHGAYFMWATSSLPIAKTVLTNRDHSW